MCVVSYVRRRQVDEGEETMRTTDHCGEVTVDELSSESARELFDAMALDRLGISGEEFLAAYDRGEFTGINPDDRAGLLDVLMALPYAR